MPSAAPLAAHVELVYQLALWVLGLALAISVVTDLRSRLIYNVVTLPALAIELALIGLSAGWSGLLDAAIGFGIFCGPFLLGTLWREDAVGMGDVKLAALVGVVAGAAGSWPGAIKALFWFSVAYLVHASAVWLVALARRRQRPKYLPVAPSIAAGTLAAWLIH